MNRILLLHTYIFICISWKDNNGNKSADLWISYYCKWRHYIHSSLGHFEHLFKHFISCLSFKSLKSGFSLLWKPFSKENSNLFVCPTLCQASWFDGMEQNNVFLLKHTNAIRSMPWYLYDMLCCLRDVRFPTMHKNERYIISM